MSKIYQNTFSYLLAKLYVNWAFKKYYSEVIIVGEENIPKDEAVIYAPNHTNALMDALAILSLPPFKLPKVFLARADIFNLPKMIVKFIQWIKIMPAYRIRDGYDNLAKNQDSFNVADEVLLNNAAMCLMPEGSQELEYKIRPLVKGIFRIAFSAQQKMPEGKNVYILPIGLNYGDLIKQGKHLIINIGKPISANDYMNEYAVNPAIAINQIKDKLKTELEQLSLHINSKEYYDAFDTAIQVSNQEAVKWMDIEPNTLNLFYARQKTAEVLYMSQTTKPDKIEALSILSKKYKKTVQKTNLPFAQFNEALPSSFKNFSNLLKFTILFLLSFPGIILNILPYFIISQIPKWIKIKFEGFFSSVYYVGGLLLFPLFYLLQSIILSFAFGLSWVYILIFLVLHFFIGKANLYLYHVIHRIYDQIRYYYIFQKKANKFTNLQSLRNNILQLVEYLFRQIKVESLERN